MRRVKTVTFMESDKELIKKIEKYQREQGLKSFVDAVRKLCNDALDLKRITKR